MKEHEWRFFSLVWTAVLKLGPPAVLLVSALAAQPANAQNKAPFSGLDSYVKWMQRHHKAPFDRDGSALPPGGAKALRDAGAKALRLAKPVGAASFKNDQVNQDRNPWPKAEVAGD
jgi:hypothetical protein